MDQKKKMRLDDLLTQHLGSFGIYQKLHYILTGIPCIWAGMHALSWTFTAGLPNFRCRYPGENYSAMYEPADSVWYEKLANLTSNPRSCHRFQNVTIGDLLPYNNSNLKTESCNDGYVWDRSEFALSAVDRWSLVCDRDFIPAVIQAIYFIGQFTGSIVFGILSDKIGRKPVFLMAIFLQLVVGSCLALAPNWELVALLRFGSGFGNPGVFIMSCVIGAELVGPKYRVWSSVSAGVFWALGEVILGALSYPLRDYRYLQLAISLPAIVLVSYWWLLPESARWLMSQSRHADMNRILQHVAACNKKPPLPPDWHERVEKCASAGLSYRQSIVALFRTPRLRIRTLINFVLWAVVTIGYYGLAFNPSFMGGDNRLGFILSGLFELPGLVCVLLINIVGRKLISVIGLLIAAVCLALTLAIPPDHGLASLLLVVIGKSALTAVFALVYIWTPEHYPTNIRNTATGACSMIGRIGGIAASFFSLYLANDYPAVVAITYASLSAIAAFLAMFLPETAGEPLLETIEEAEDLGRDQSIFIMGYQNEKKVKQRLMNKSIMNHTSKM